MQPNFLSGAVAAANRADELDRCEESHWWYRALRDLLARLIQSPRFAVRRGGRVLDAGCGTGANLRLLSDLLAPSYLGGFDVNERCIAAARRKCPTADVYHADFARPQFARAQYDLIVSCDVVCAVGLANCAGAFAQFAERLAPQGRLMLHLPVYPWLYGEHDIAVGNIERHDERPVRATLERAGLAVEFTSHRLCLAFPAIVAARWGRRAGSRFRPRSTLRSDLDRSTGGGLWWDTLAALENAALSRGLTWPFGASLVVVARRKDDRR